MSLQTTSQVNRRLIEDSDHNASLLCTSDIQLSGCRHIVGTQVALIDSLIWAFCLSLKIDPVEILLPGMMV